MDDVPGDKFISNDIKDSDMKRYLSALLLSVFVMIWSGISQAAGPYGLPGHLNSVDLKNHRLIIDDRVFDLATGYTVKNSKGEVVSAFYLKKGQKLDCRLNANGKLEEIIIKR
jgi:hypothetical protein